MAWYAVGATVAGAVLNSGNSQGGTATQTKDPWAAAVPWLTQNLGTGQQLQQYYQQNPFNQQQQNAYSNMGSNSDYARQLASSVLGQMNNFKPFSQANPSATPMTYQFPTMPTQQAGSAMQPAAQSAMPSNNLNISANPFRNGGIAAPAAPAGPGGGVPLTPQQQYLQNMGNRITSDGA